MTCSHCGATIKNDVSYCPNCGSRVESSQNRQFDQNGYNQNQQFGQNGYNQNQQFNQNGYNQNRQFNQNGYNQNQQFGQNGYNQNQPYQQGFPKPSISERNIVLCIILSLVTCGIYSIIWLVSMVDDLNLVSEEPNPTSGGMVFLLGLITCNIYTLYWMYKSGDLLNAAKYRRGLPTDSNSGILYLVLTLFGFGIVSYCLIQNELNKIANA